MVSETTCLLKPCALSIHADSDFLNKANSLSWRHFFAWQARRHRASYLHRNGAQNDPRGSDLQQPPCGGHNDAVP
ncbi:MAG: hypothetical protein CBB71_21405 [Rhodopirellula sp. TMED11]|nr:MAG: hypothetical protein CBB71_21405 [Rhodopirellula sp. TMED11]